MQKSGMNYEKGRGKQDKLMIRETEEPEGYKHKCGEGIDRGV
jgi:hypothetical protein